MQDTSTILADFVTGTYGEDPDCPDHLYLKVLTLARTLDDNPGSVYAMLLVAVKELTHALEIMRNVVEDVHDDIDWLDEHLARVYPAWYTNPDEGKS